MDEHPSPAMLLLLLAFKRCRIPGDGLSKLFMHFPKHAEESLQEPNSLKNINSI